MVQMLNSMFKLKVNWKVREGENYLLKKIQNTFNIEILKTKALFPNCIPNQQTSE